MVKRIAWLSPLPPQKSGVADYSYGLLKGLKEFAAIDLFYDAQKPSEIIVKTFAAYPLSLFPDNYKKYDEVIYHLGNNCEFHRNIYKLAWNYPGMIVLHDYNIHPFLQNSFWGGHDESLYQKALLEGYGEAGQRALEELITHRAIDLWKYPMSHAIVKRSKKVIVHHRWVKKQFPESEHIETIPLAAKIDHQPTPQDIDRFKDKYHLDDKHFIISCLGFVNRNKLPELQTEVIKMLLAEGYPVKMIFAGEVSPEVKILQEEIRASPYSEEIIFTGYQNETDYFNARSMEIFSLIPNRVATSLEIKG